METKGFTLYDIIINLLNVLLKLLPDGQLGAQLKTLVDCVKEKVYDLRQELQETKQAYRQTQLNYEDALEELADVNRKADEADVRAASMIIQNEELNERCSLYQQAENKALLALEEAEKFLNNMTFHVMLLINSKCWYPTAHMHEGNLKKIPIIKLYKEVQDCSIKTAKETVESWCLAEADHGGEESLGHCDYWTVKQVEKTAQFAKIDIKITADIK